MFIKDDEFLKLEQSALELSKKLDEIYTKINSKYPPPPDKMWILYSNGFNLIHAEYEYDYA